MQDNQLHANLTVAEAMKVASNLKLGSHATNAEKEEVVRVFELNSSRVRGHRLGLRSFDVSEEFR